MMPAWDHRRRIIHVLTEDGDGTGIRTQQFDLSTLSWSDGDDHPTAASTEGDSFYATRFAASWPRSPKLDVVYYYNSKVTYSDEWNQSFNLPPNAPIWRTDSNQIHDINKPLNLHFLPDDPDGETTPSGVRYRRQIAATPTDTDWLWWNSSEWSATKTGSSEIRGGGGSRDLPGGFGIHQKR